MEILTDYNEYLPAIDVADGLRRLMNNKKIYFNLLKRFDGRELTNDLINNMKDGDFPNIKKNAHTLKGVAANLALAELRNLAIDIEARAKAEEDCSDMTDALDEAVNAANRSIRTLLERADIS